MDKLTLQQVIPMSELEGMIRQTTFRGLYDKHGENLHPYKKAKFSLTTIYPEKYAGSSPEILIGKKRFPLFTPQPTIYENQTNIIKTVDKFLRSKKLRIDKLDSGVKYHWEGRGDFHVLPPIIEKHTYPLKNGFLDFKKLSKRFKGTHVRDARKNLHSLSEKYLNGFYIDEVSKFDYLYIFNPNSPIINYGVNYNGDYTFYTICDGSHRVDYALEILGKPITALLVEPEEKTNLIPYYAFPVPFRPTLRLSSKRSEKMYHRLERDKIHLLNDFICKSLHYDWESGGLQVSKLRSNVEIH